MLFEELKRSLAEKAERIYLLQGGDDFLRDYAVELIKQKYLTSPELNYSAYDGTNFCDANADEAVNALNSYPFMSEKRVILITEYYPKTTDLKNSDFCGYFSNPQETSILIIENKKENKVFEKLKNITIVDCKTTMNVCSMWIRSQAKKGGLAVGNAAIKSIAEYSLMDMTKINNETKKLVDYCNGGAEITVEAVEEIVVKDTEYQIYQMTEFIADKQFDKAYETLFSLLAQNESEQKLFVSLYSYFRRLFYIALSDKSDGEIADSLGVKEYAVKMSRRQAKKYSVYALKEIIKNFADEDVNFKMGNISLDNAFFNSVFNIMIKN